MCIFFGQKHIGGRGRGRCIKKLDHDDSNAIDLEILDINPSIAPKLTPPRSNGSRSFSVVGPRAASLISGDTSWGNQYGRFQYKRKNLLMRGTNGRTGCAQESLLLFEWVYGTSYTKICLTSAFILPAWRRARGNSPTFDSRGLWSTTIVIIGDMFFPAAYIELGLRPISSIAFFYPERMSGWLHYPIDHPERYTWSAERSALTE